MTPTSAIEGMLGYLNLSDGTPSPAFQKSISEFFRSGAGGVEPWFELIRQLREGMTAVVGTSATFQNVDQAAAVVELVGTRLLPAYRHHHQGLLFSLSDADLFQPFFLARCFETTLVLHGPGSAPDVVVRRALEQLNDFVGYRPVATLESGPRGVYEHERVCPIPVYLAKAGTAYGRFEGLIQATLELFAKVDPEVLAQAWFHLDRLDELALDPRAYDFSHPANQRPGYQFGEWDPHQIDRRGWYRRFVLRPTVLAALQDWIDADPAVAERSIEAAAVLGGVILVAAGVSGAGPDTHDSQTSLGTLVPRLARCRDDFYAYVLEGLEGSLGERLRQKAQQQRQPFADVRQHLNHYLARQRTVQKRHRRLASLYAQMGYPEGARREALRIPTASVRMTTEIECLLTTGHRACERGDWEGSVECVEGIERLFERGIACGALVDPWNILGFAGNFSIFVALEDTAVDPRVDELLSLVQRHCELYGHALRETAASGQAKLQLGFERALARFTEQWDRYATDTVSGVRRVCGRELAQSALFVAEVLAHWRQSGAAAGDIAFWKEYADRFDSPQAFALVLTALLERDDYVAAMALLMQWLSQSDLIPLEDGRFSFSLLALRWMVGVVRSTTEVGRPMQARSPAAVGLIKRFFDFLEANAERYWHVPGLEDAALEVDEDFDEDFEFFDEEDEEEDELFSAAYEDVVYRDTAADGQDADVMDASSATDADSLVALAQPLRRRLLFLATLARLWQLAAGVLTSVPDSPRTRELLREWRRQAQRNRERLELLMEELHQHRVAPPGGAQEAVIEFYRQSELRQDLLALVIATATETAHAVARLREPPTKAKADWESVATHLFVALRNGVPDEAERLLGRLLNLIADKSLLYVPLDRGGDPRAIYRTRYLRETLRNLAAELPRHGLLRRTHALLEAALRMERAGSSDAWQVSEFAQLYHVGYTGAVECLAESLLAAGPARPDDERTAMLVGQLVGRFSRLWVRHTSSVRLSAVEQISTPAEWEAVVAFIVRYGADLFTQKFMNQANLHGILQQGTGAFLEQLGRESPSPALRLLQDLDRRIDRSEAAQLLESILRVIVEQYDAYKDYNATTPQSDGGDNLYMLLELLRVMIRYERHRWAFEPAYVAHRILVRHGLHAVADLLQRAFAEETEPVAVRLETRLREVENRYTIRVPTIAERLAEHFVRPLELNQILARTGPAIQAARAGQDSEAMGEFVRQVDAFADRAAGAGQDHPAWLQQLETEVARCLAELPDRQSQPLETGQRVRVKLEDLERQLNSWDDPA